MLAHRRPRPQAADPPHDRRRRVGSPLAAIRQVRARGLRTQTERPGVATGARGGPIATDISLGAQPRSGHSTGVRGGVLESKETPRIPDVTTPTPTTPKPRRRWLKFSLRALLVLLLASGTGFGWFACKMKQARQQREAVTAIEKLGGRVCTSPHPAV